MSAEKAYEIKSAILPLVSIALRSTNLAQLNVELTQNLALTPNFFSQDPIVIDLHNVADAQGDVDFAALIQLLRSHNMVPVAVKGGNGFQMADALAAGLSEAPDAHDPRSATKTETVVQEVIREVVREVAVPQLNPPVIIDRPLRSGQQVYAKGADLIVLAMVSFDAEIIADGSIHVYAPLRGKALAGARGNTGARIFATTFEPQLISINGIYRTQETPLPANVAGKGAQAYLDNEKLILTPLGL